MKIAVAGGTGLVGTKVVELLRARGDEVVVLARSTGVDLTTGAGLSEALAGVEVIVDATSITSTTKSAEIVDFFDAVARNLQSFGAAAGAKRIVTLSISGIDGVGGGVFSHYDGKHAQEAATQAGPVPTVILRAAQFHNYPGMMIDWTAKGPIMPVAKCPVRTVEVDAVAEHLVRLATEPVSADHVVVNLVGPEKQMLTDLVRATATARGQRLTCLPVWLPGKAAKLVRNGTLQGPPDALVDSRTFEDWLARTYT